MLEKAMCRGRGIIRFARNNMGKKENLMRISTGETKEQNTRNIKI